MKPLKTLTIGGATQDVTFHSKEGILIDNKRDLTKQKLLGFEFGAKINVHQVDFTFGGGAANSAIAFSKLGLRVTSLICLGNDAAGKEMLNNLKKHRIKTNLVQISEKKSGLSFVINAKQHGEEHVLFTYRGANEDLNLARLPQGFGERAFNFDLIYLTSLSGRNSKINLSRIFRWKNKFPKTKIAWNPGNEQLKLGLGYLKNYLKNTNVFIVNKDEAIEICLTKGQCPKSNSQKAATEGQQKINNPRILLKQLSKYCPNGVIVITDGANGAYCYYNKKIYYEPSIKIKEKDTTGVGDAFGSTFSWALEYTNYDIQKSLGLAIKNACSVLKQVGAQNGLLDKKTLLSS